MTRKRKRMTRKRINVIKGFTVPAGYTLNITKDDGSVLTKEAGDASGGNYSFEQVVQGVDPDWQLDGEAAPEQPQRYFLTPDILSNSEVPFEAFEQREFSKFDAIPKEVTEFLGGLAKPLRTKIFAKTKGKLAELQALSVEEIKLDPEYEEYGGYLNPVLAKEQLESQLSLAVELNKKPEHYVRHADHTLSALYHWDELHPVAKELSNFDDFHAAVIDQSGEMKDIVVGASSVEGFRMTDELPSLGESGEVKYHELRDALTSVKNPVNIRTLFRKMTRSNGYREHMNKVDKLQDSINELEFEKRVLKKQIDSMEGELDAARNALNAGIDEYQDYRKTNEAALTGKRSREEFKEVRDKLDEMMRSNSEKDVTFMRLADIKRDAVNLIIDKEAEIVKVKADRKRLKESFFVNKFRLVMSDNVNIDDFIIERPAPVDNTPKRAIDMVIGTQKVLGTENFSQEQKDGLAFAVGFVHPILRPKICLLVDKEHKRASADALGNIRCSPWATPTTLAHEVGHLIEYSNATLATTVIPFLYNRVGKPGEKAVALAELEPHSGFEGYESTIRDNFESAYTGKIYSYASNSRNPVSGYTLKDLMISGGISASEIVSMGIQHMYEDPIKFAERDPEFFDMIWKLRSSPKVRRSKRYDIR